MKIHTIGGYSEVGKNMTAVEVEENIFIFDMGFYLPKILTYAEGDAHTLPTEELIKIGVLPDDKVLEKSKDKVKAIIIGHAHLDHIGAVPYLANKYNCPIVATPYTIEIIKTLYSDRNLKFPKFIKVNPNSSVTIAGHKLGFINVPHSTLQVALVSLETKEGNVLYANDFKMDYTPVLNKKLDMSKFKELKDKKVKLLILDALNSRYQAKTPSERVARELLRDVLLGVEHRNKVIVVTTFSSHLPRLKSIIEFGKKLNRKMVFLGRSLQKYVEAAEKLKLTNFSKDAQLVGFPNQVKKKLKQIEKNPGDYIIVCTGNQGEPDAILSRMARGELPWNFKPDDIVIFSCRTIPSPETEANRQVLERTLRQKHVRIFKDVHVSGHLSLEDHRDVINLLTPENLIPAHGGKEIVTGLIDLAVDELGYKLGKSVHLMHDGAILEL